MVRASFLPVVAVYLAVILIDYNEDNKSMGMFDWNISICYCISKV